MHFEIEHLARQALRLIRKNLSSYNYSRFETNTIVYKRLTELFIGSLTLRCLILCNPDYT